MKVYIAIDGGTTNTRISLFENGEIADTIKMDVGARASVENTVLLKNGIKSAIEKILKDNNLKEDNVIRILASGMITSEFGLCHLEHIKTPAGIDELHNSMYETHLKEISDIPFVFIRGVKNDAITYENTDIMRGEETELMGIIKPEYGQCIYILPGSHSKIIKVDDSGRITDFSTMLTGEMIFSLSQQTILKDAVDLSVSELDNEFLLKGYDYCKDNGINKALFKIRILKNIFRAPKKEIYSFFIGTVLCGEIENIIKTEAKTVVIGGKAQIKNAVSQILKYRDNKKVVSLDEGIVNNSTVLGTVTIFENYFK